MIMRWIILLLLAVQLNAATYYVSTTGNDSTGDGSSGSPWATLGKAAGLVDPGDTVNVAAGTYAETVTLTRAGTLASPVRWIGAGETTIIQPSVAASSGWVVHSGPVYKHESLPFAPSALIADGKYVMRIVNVDPFATTTRLTPSGSYIGASSSAIWRESTTPLNEGPYWEGVGALWDYSGGVCYVRFGDDSNANSHSIRIMENGGLESHYGVSKAPFYVAADYQHISGFQLRHAHAGLYVDSGVKGSVISSNFINTCWVPLLIRGGSNYVSANVIEHNFFAGAITGAWEAGSSMPWWPAAHAYFFSKERSSTSLLSAPAIGLYKAASSNVITANLLTNVVSGISAWLDSSTPVTQTRVSSNSFYNSSSVGVALGRGNGHDLSYIHDNLFANVNIPFRQQYYNRGTYSANANTRTYWYRNRIWCPPNLGAMIYWHGESGQTFVPETWIYHNSYEGGRIGLGRSTSVASQMGKTHLINNIIGTPDTIEPAPLYDQLGDFSFNVFAMSDATTTSGANFVNSPKYEWGGASASATLPDFELNDGSVAISKGLPVHETFTLNSVSYPALPGYTGVYYSGTQADIGAVPYEFISETVTNVLSFRTGGAPVFDVLTDSDDGDSAILVVQRAQVLVDGELVDNTEGDCPFTFSTSGPDGAVEDVDYSVLSNSGQINDGSWYALIAIQPMRNTAYTGQRIVRVQLEPGAAYELSGQTYYDVILLDADLPPSTFTRPQPQPGHGSLPAAL